MTKIHRKEFEKLKHKKKGSTTWSDKPDRTRNFNGVMLFIIIWNISGWDSKSSIRNSILRIDCHVSTAEWSYQIPFFCSSIASRWLPSSSDHQHINWTQTCDVLSVYNTHSNYIYKVYLLDVNVIIQIIYVLYGYNTKSWYSNEVLMTWSS